MRAYLIPGVAYSPEFLRRRAAEWRELAAVYEASIHTPRDALAVPQFRSLAEQAEARAQRGGL